MRTAKKIIGAAAIAIALVPVWGQGIAQLRKAPEALVPPEPETALQGIMVSNDEWTDLSQAGVYKIDARSGGSVTCLYRSQYMANTAAAVMHNNIMYAISVEGAKYYVDEYSCSTWSRTRHEETDGLNTASDLTYDPKTRTVYGGFWESNEDYPYFCSYNLSQGERTEIFTAERDIYGIAATPEGDIYTLYGSTGWIGKVNGLGTSKPFMEYLKKNPIYPEVNPYKGICNSMTYDAANNRLLAVICEESMVAGVKSYVSKLWQFNPETGEGSVIMQMPGNACFAGIYVVDGTPDPMAPATAVAMTVVPDAADFSKGNLSFNVPTKTVGGVDLQERVMAIVQVNGVENVYGYYEAGQKVEIPVELKDGDNTVRVILCTDEHRGDAVEKKVFAGYDSPVAVAKVEAKVTDGVATISWTAPTEGANGGMLNPESLRYTLTRMPDNKVLVTDYGQTTYTDSEIPASARVIYYTVLAYNDINPAPNSTESNRVSAAGAFSVPYTESFDSSDDFALWTIVDNNEDPTWSYNSNDKCAAYYNPQGKIAGDDWLISPDVKLEKDKLYKVRYEYRANMAKYPETFSVMAGMGTNPEAMTVELNTHTDITNTKLTVAETAFTATESGQWNIGFHYTSDMRQYGVSIDNVTITEFDGRVPAAVSDLTVTPGERGALSAKVTFTVPTKDANGNNLTEVSKAELFREDVSTTQPIQVFEEITPGQALAHEDEVDKAGVYTYMVKVYNVTEAGMAASARAFVGEDVPAAPETIAVTEEGTHPVVSWNAPSTGDNGGWFDPEKVTYSVYRNGTSVASGLTATSFTDEKYTIPTDKQDAIIYIVISHYNGKVSRGAQTDAVLVGAPYKAPATESFPEAEFVFYPWIAQSDMAPTYGWTLETSGVNPVVADNTGDRGLACFHAVGEVKGMLCHFFSPKFDISGLDSPALTFYMYHTPGIEGDGNLQVFISDGGDYVAAGEPIARAEGDADGWTRHTVMLGDYKGAKSLRFRFTATGDAAANIFVDDIKLDNLNESDAAIVAFNAPVKVAAAQSFPVEVKIENIGLLDLSGLTLSISDGTAEVASKSEIAIAQNSSVVVTLNVALPEPGARTLTATLTGDGVADNNTAKASISVVEPVLPTVSGLNASVADGQVTLSWKAPHEAGHVTDDVESYTDWAIDAIGQWTMFDGDYATTVYINKDLGEYPNASARKAFQVCNASTLGIDIWEQGKTHSGNKMFMAVASNNYVNNDWLISPRLNGAEQWISFYARSFTVDGVAPERMKVWYSTTDTDPVNFIELTENYVELPATWVEYRYHLPEGARYFAINCVSDDSFAMFVDDISFNDMTVPAWKLTGYEITCNGQSVGTTATNTFTHANTEGKGTYAVRPVYEQGNGAFCSALEVMPSGIAQLPAGVNVYTIPGAIVVEGTEADVIITTADGRARTQKAGKIPAETGIYLVTVEGITTKVAVQ